MTKSNLRYSVISLGDTVIIINFSYKNKLPPTQEQAMLKVIAFDLDGTLTQHKTPLCDENRNALEALSRKYKLLMVGAGQVMRIFNQMEGFPIDIIGNYGLQFGKYNPDTKQMDIVRDLKLPCDRESVAARIEQLRVKYGFTQYAGESVEYHPSGCVTFPLIGTKAKQEDKLAFDHAKNAANSTTTSSRRSATMSSSSVAPPLLISPPSPTTNATPWIYIARKTA